MSCQRISHKRLSLLWEGAALSLWLCCCCWASGAGGAAAAAGQGDSAPGSLGWLLSDKGPFHQSLEFTEAAERYQQGFSTRYKIYREFGRWKVNSLAVEKREGFGGSGGLALPLDPDFMHTIRQLGRRPTLQTITESLIKKYGTHVLFSATLGGEESLTIFVDKRKLSQESSPTGADGSRNRSSNTTGSVTLEDLHQLAASYFTDRESTLRRLHHLQIASTAIRVTETRTGPLGCSNYDNLDTVSSVLVHSPENKVQLQGLQVILPGYLQSRFIQAALNYIGCKSEGQFVCQSSDCWCKCSVDFPQCNCPLSDLDTLESNLLRIRDTLRLTYQKFEESEEFQSFVGKLPTHYAVNTSVVEHMWRTDASMLQRYRQLETSSNQLFTKARHAANKLFSLSKRCRKKPKIVLQRTRPLHFWLSYALSVLYCSENNQVGVYSDESRSCSCPYNHPPCQGLIPCSVGDGVRCSSCSSENRTRCSGCNLGFTLIQGACRPAVPDPTDPYLGLESDRDLQDLELRYLLQRRDPRIALNAVFVSNDVRVNTWFDPSWRKRMLLTLKSNRVKSNRVHMLLGLALQFCLTRNSTLEPALSLFVNPFGGSHSESWTMPIGQHGYPDWERTKLDIPLDCYNWTLTVGNRWKSFFETVHFYLRSRIRDPVGVTGGNKNMTVYYEPLEATEPSNNIGYMKVNSMQLFGYSIHFDPEAIQDLILQIDYPYTQGSQDSALLQLVELRYRVNRLSPPGAPHVDLFACLLRHRLKLPSADVTRILTALQAFSARQPNYAEYEANKLCS
ncbi:BMP/retinoic acid-inducible neural-specific protein 3-like isoform X1 [Sander lucioperca]|uniref:Bone morphogenetic protein/retinoic acid inducible neural-specific 3b n=1 Tax=Sander lucioperca TaxID=283035 RepID=A0A8C9X4H1_SANLU|nr:BMP/retinoic acid-inducible neural-specific protein 3-like isoform X1 [Sander lucioperca]XP_031149548.1 BMP/retinoic acid-inducible neural-specific protein 3-like isoform X1 [Sander lucioperca]